MIQAPFRNWSVRTKLAFLLVATSLLPLGISAYIDVLDVRQQRLHEAQNLLTARADQIASELDSVHLGYLRSTQRVANQPAVQTYCTVPSAGRAQHEARLLGIFGTFPKSDPAIHGMALLDASGRVVLASETRIVGADLSSRTIVRAALQGSPMISSVAFAPWQGELQPTVAYMVPVRDAQGQVVCVVALGVRAQAFWTLLKSADQKAGPGSFAILADEGGVRIGHSSTPSLIYRPAAALPADALALQVAQGRFGPQTRALLQDVQPAPEIFERARASVPDTAVFRGWAQGNQAWNHGVARRLKQVPWTVFYLSPEANVQAEIARVTRDKVLLALGIMAAAGALGWAFAASILRPVRALSNATDALAAGDADARVAIHGTNELGRLAASFNTMADHIQVQAADLQKSHDQMHQHAQELEVAMQDLEAFASSVSHDLRAPLHVVQGFSKALEAQLGGQLDAKATHYLSRIRAGVVHMDEVVEGILRLSRLGRQPLHRQPVDLNPLVDEVLEHLRGDQTLTHQQVTVAAGLPTVQADRVLLRQVFANLLSNACKFTARQAQPAISVGCEMRDGEWVCFVRDNGAGFNPAHATRLFQPFERLHHASEFAGLGIGLSIVRRIVHRHGGRIWAEAAEGQGACFYFTLGS